ALLRPLFGLGSCPAVPLLVADRRRRAVAADDAARPDRARRAAGRGRGMNLLLLLGSMLALALVGVPLVFALLAGALITLLVTRPHLPLEVVPQFFIQG